VPEETDRELNSHNTQTCAKNGHRPEHADAKTAVCNGGGERSEGSEGWVREQTHLVSWRPANNNKTYGSG
jgi:hypothetical protein